MGYLANTGSMIRMSAWRKHPYSDAYAAGGEDSEWAKWAFAHDYRIIYDPAVSMHHSHDLNRINRKQQRQHWKTVFANPGEFEQQTIVKRRPDLFN